MLPGPKRTAAGSNPRSAEVKTLLGERQLDFSDTEVTSLFAS